MRVSREKFAENRERILDVAARLFREKGFDGIGVADIMKAAGLTHGGFYGHFASKEDLIAQASERAAKVLVAEWEHLAQTQPQTALSEMASVYLSESHRDHPGEGCGLSALGPDIARQSGAVRGAVTDVMRRRIATLEQAVSGATPVQKREAALAAYATLVGALVLARVSNDPELSRELLAAGRAGVAVHGRTTPDAV